MSKRLLLADDSITIQKVIQITFAHEDYELTITDNGDAAFARARDLAPDLVLADVYMPGKNGYELCAAIKQDPALRQTPVLLLAGSFEPFDEGKARASGADAWIEKPFESQALIDKVAALLAAAAGASAAPSPPAPVAAPAVPVAAAPPVAAIPADPFADISFDEPAAVAAPAAPPAVPDDWSDLTVAPAAPVAAPAPQDFAFEPAPAAPPIEFPAEPPVAQEPSVFDSSVATPADFDVFGGAEEVMALGDDDILGAEDLEPAGELPSLSPWSREVAPLDEAFESFAEPAPLNFAPPIEPPPAPVAPSLAPAAPVPPPVAPVAAPPVMTPPVAAPPVATAPVAEPVVAAPTVAAAAVEQRVATLSEAEIEQIVERAVGKVIEKLAGTLIEKVAWEVVPDLAEALIKEEIRKIKDAAA